MPFVRHSCPIRVMVRLTRKFFEQKTLTVAHQLLGNFLIRKIGTRVIRAKIIETEGYCGSNDLASHASVGRTKRTEVMFGRAGQAYVYLIYGRYYCFNIVTERKNYPAAVLIRGVEIAGEKIIGPGKVCQALKIDKRFNNQDLINSRELWLEKNQLKVKVEKSKVRKLPRVNVDYAKKYKDKPWRFVLQ